jgi:hypothetical protein
MSLPTPTTATINIAMKLFVMTVFFLFNRACCRHQHCQQPHQVYDNEKGTLSWSFDAKTHPGGGAFSRVSWTAFVIVKSRGKEEKLANIELQTHH